VSRTILVRLHRLFGLMAAAFLIVSGITGTMLAFRGEIDGWLNADLTRVESGDRSIGIDAAVARVEKAFPQAEVTGIPLARQPGRSLEIGVSPKGSAIVPFDTAFVDPATGRIMGTRSLEGCCDRRNLMQFVYRLHYTLQGGQFWRTLLGWIAFAWAVDCLVGLWLTFPLGRPFLKKWKPAWQVKWHAATYRRNLDLHRSAGLWFLPVYATLAVTGVYYNLRSEIFMPVLTSFTTVRPGALQARGTQPVSATPPISFEAAVHRAMEAAAAAGIGDPPLAIRHHRPQRMFGVSFGLPSQSGAGPSSVFVDDRNGDIVDLRKPMPLVKAQGFRGEILWTRRKVN